MSGNNKKFISSKFLCAYLFFYHKGPKAQGHQKFQLYQAQLFPVNYKFPHISAAFGMDADEIDAFI